MADYELGYGRPPRHSQFKKGVCANPRGRPRRFNPEIGDVVYRFLSAKTQHREKGQTKQTSRLELAIKHHINAALNGNVGSTIMLLKMRAHGLKFGDTGPLIIQIVNALPPFPYEVNLHCPKRKFEFARATQRRATKYHATVVVDTISSLSIGPPHGSRPHSSAASRALASAISGISDVGVKPLRAGARMSWAATGRAVDW
jgi:hypothetical protein